MKEFLTIDELCDYLNLKKSFVYAKVESGELPCYRIGRLLRFKRQVVDAWMEGNRKGATEVVKGKKTPKPTQKRRTDIHGLVENAIAKVKGVEYIHNYGRPDQDKAKKEVSLETL